MAHTADRPVRDRLEDAFRERHSNPKSGRSRTLLTPLFVLACHRRDGRLFLATLVATVLDPVAFPPLAPEVESWTTRGVRAGRWWIGTGHGTIGRDPPTSSIS